MPFTCHHHFTPVPAMSLTMVPFSSSDLAVFLEHETLRVKQFETLLIDKTYMTVVDALYQTFGKLVKLPTCEDSASKKSDVLEWVQKYEAARSSRVVAGKNSIDQDLCSCSIAILRVIYEYVPIPCNLYQMLELLATSAEELHANPMYQGFTNHGLVEMT